jgi:hypothetical protein
MKLPKKFTINTQEIKVKVVDTLSESRYGEYNSINDTIQVAKRIIDGDGIEYVLTEEQILNTFIHELLHAFQWHSKGETSEEESSTYAGYFVEFLKSTKLINSLNNA